MAAKSAPECHPVSTVERQLVDSIKQALGSRFQFIAVAAWAQSEQRPSDAELTQRVCNQIPGIASGQEFRITNREANCLTASSSGSRRHLILAWVDESRSWCVYGWTSSDDPTLAARCTQLAICNLKRLDESNQLSALVESFSEQVTSDFEELAWLRELSLRIEHCEVSQDLSVVAEALLPTLRNLVRAEALVLVEKTSIGSSVGRLNDLRISHWSGDPVVSRATVEALIEVYGDRARSQPVVVNRPGGDAAIFASVGVRSLAMLPVERGDFQFGWLIAINRIPHEVAAGTAVQLGLDEFGTIEAGLMQSATVLLSTHARNVEFFREKELLLVGTVQSLVRTLEARDPYTCGHSDRVATIAAIISDELGGPDVDSERVRLSGILHDIGKIGIPDGVLNKTERLTEEEFAVIKKHPEIGHSILKHIPSLQNILPGVLHHHEAFDGSGYPAGLVGDEIPIDGRIIAVADSFDAMTSDRPYRDGMDFARAEKILREGSGTQWQPEVINAFFARVKMIRLVASKKPSDEEVIDYSAPRMKTLARR